jgi:hypothetical protein
MERNTVNKLQREHMMDIIGRFIQEWTAKYSNGTIEHKTNLGEDFSVKQLNKMMKEEILDLVSYYYAIEIKLEKLQEENRELRRLLDER